LTVILDAQTDEYSYGKFSEGFKVLLHGQGEYIDELEGINVGPGQHVIIALTEKRVTNNQRYTQSFFALICRSLLQKLN